MLEEGVRRPELIVVYPSIINWIWLGTVLEVILFIFEVVFHLFPLGLTRLRPFESASSA